jgi:hypothetical protein
MKTWIAAIVVMMALAYPSSAFAHEGHAHKALGTITSVQADKVEIKTTDGKMLTLVLDKKTTVTRGKDKLDTTALKTGERVSVEYMEAKKVMTAHSFKLGTTQTATK